MARLMMFMVLVLSSLLLGYQTGRIRSQAEGQNTEVRSEKLEVRSQMTEGSSQKTENRIRKGVQQSEICNLKSEIGSPQSAIRNSQSAIGSPQSEICNLKSEIIKGTYLKGYLYRGRKGEALADIFQNLWDAGWRFGANSNKGKDKGMQRFIDRVIKRTKVQDNRLLADGVIDFSPEKKKSPKDYRQRFINKVAGHVNKLDTQVPAELIIAQACLETGYGKFEKCKNLFCMTGTGPAGYYRHGDHDYVKGKKIYRIKKFRAYHTYEQAINDLVNWYRERNLLSGQCNLDNILAGLSQSGYASDPNYTSKIRGIIRKYDL